MKHLSCLFFLMAALLQVHAAENANQEVMAGVIKSLEGKDAKITSITAYAIPVDAERRFSYAVQKGRLHVFIRFTAGEHHGWTEFNVSRAIPEAEVADYLASQLKWYGPSDPRKRRAHQCLQRAASAQLKTT